MAGTRLKVFSRKSRFIEFLAQYAYAGRMRVPGLPLSLNANGSMPGAEFVQWPTTRIDMSRLVVGIGIGSR